MTEWHKQVPVGKKFRVKYAHWWQQGEGVIGIAQIGYDEQFPIALTGLDFGSGVCCYHTRQLEEIKEGGK